MFVRNFKSFQSKKRTSENVSESVEVRDDKFIVGGIVVTQTMINKYKTRIKKETGKDANQFASDKEIAETLTSYLVSKASDDIDTVPTSALLGGEDEMSSQVDEVSVEEEPVEVEEDGIVDPLDGEFGDEDEVSDDVLGDEVGDEFESPLPEEDTLPEEDVEELEELDDELTGDLDDLDEVSDEDSDDKLEDNEDDLDEDDLDEDDLDEELPL